MNKKLYVDLDGVLADFEAGIKSLGYELSELAKDKVAFNEVKKLFAEKELFLNLPLLDDALKLWEGIKHYKPVILTAVGKNNSEIHAAHKKLWVEKFFGPDVEFCWVERSWEKDAYADENAFLIDDRAKSLDPFLAANGNGVLHKNAEDSIEAVEEWFANDWKDW